MFSWTVYKWEAQHCMQVYWPSGLKCSYATMVVNGILFGVMIPLEHTPTHGEPETEIHE